MKNKKTKIAIISVVALLLVLIGVTYAYWLVTKPQTNNNIISSACLDITLDNEANDISLSSQYPMNDEEGMKLVPYTFTVTNNCNTSIDYQVALESVGDAEKSISSSALKVAIDNNIKRYIDFSEATSTLYNTYESRILLVGTLHSSGSTKDRVTHYLRIWIDENAPISESNKVYQSKITVTVGQNVSSGSIKEGTLAYDILETAQTNNSFYEDSVNFENPIISGLYKTQDDLGDSYYYRGNVENNYVQFGSYKAGTQLVRQSAAWGFWYYSEETGWEEFSGFYSSYEQCVIDAQNFNATCGEQGVNEEIKDLTEDTPMLWQIIRINGDNTIRLLYVGIKDDDISQSEWAVETSGINSGFDINNLSYTFIDEHGNRINNPLKNSVDNWYNMHLKQNYSSYIADGIFCNDKEITEQYFYDENWELTSDKTDYSTDIFGASTRLRNKNPKLTCSNDEDKYTMSDSIGNGYLTEPIGLISADEVMFAGCGKNVSSAGNYLNYYTSYYTLSPASKDFQGQQSYIFSVMSNCVLSDYDLASYVRPVINLRADVEFTGDGSFENPYVIVTE